jgi:hypothetical protein
MVIELCFVTRKLLKLFFNILMSSANLRNMGVAMCHKTSPKSRGLLSDNADVLHLKQVPTNISYIRIMLYSFDSASLTSRDA